MVPSGSTQPRWQEAVSQRCTVCLSTGPGPPRPGIGNRYGTRTNGRSSSEATFASAPA